MAQSHLSGRSQLRAPTTEMAVVCTFACVVGTIYFRDTHTLDLFSHRSFLLLPSPHRPLRGFLNKQHASTRPEVSERSFFSTYICLSREFEVCLTCKFMSFSRDDKSIFEFGGCIASSPLTAISIIIINHHHGLES